MPVQKGDQQPGAQQYCSCSSLCMSILADRRVEGCLRSVMHGSKYLGRAGLTLPVTPTYRQKGRLQGDLSVKRQPPGRQPGRMDRATPSHQPSCPAWPSPCG